MAVIPTRSATGPHIMVGGFRGAAATWLARGLQLFPGVGSVTDEEGDPPRFFTENHGKGIDWYRSLLPETPLIVDVEPGLFTRRKAVQRLLLTVPSATVVVAVWSPLDRYASMIRMGQRQRPRPPVAEAARDDVWRRRVLDPGCYADVLANTVDRYQRDRVQVIVVDDEQLMSDLGDLLARRGLAARAARPGGELSVPSPGDGLSEADRRFLRAYYRMANERLEDMIGRRLSWS